MVETTGWPELEFVCNGGGGCVLVEVVAGAVVIRDSKNPYQAGLVFSRREYADFRRRVRGGSLPRRAVRRATRVLRRVASRMTVAADVARGWIRGWIRDLLG
ncbi:uncharacterized protein DUF397 [Actinomadura pelletieri DSM 43383]|uniref:Uncharacterized protein DUF397 n=1 Tax=Actinomadura pelletieri DSM 43383 TaxID=1120940 RepID=A0A495QUM7_9ACTN|nr:DUF397 domain-containing protein [Actinomadura pelletieri]RKS77131.1 uncharacterized protein DUF397 [Actinomadura pelletieri DSM 43383]